LIRVMADLWIQQPSLKILIW